MSVMEKMIRELAYELWEQAGRPEGRSDEFWFAARYELERREETGETQPPVRRPAEPPRQESTADWRVAASPRLCSITTGSDGIRDFARATQDTTGNLAPISGVSPAIPRIVRNAEDGARQEFALEGVMR